MYDPPRESAIQSIEKLKSAQVQVVMITGDCRETAQKIAETIGIYEPTKDRVLSGAELDSYDLDQLSEVIKNTTVFYRTSPSHKLVIINAFQNLGKTVAMTGDGVNDAPALKQADIGIAM
eukprot:Pgem_evm1s15874